jgi:hypothetical protein
MPDEAASMTDRELRDAIEQTVPKSEQWHALVSEACQRTSFPRSWLPTGVSTGPSTW